MVPLDTLRGRLLRSVMFWRGMVWVRNCSVVVIVACLILDKT